MGGTEVGQGRGKGANALQAEKCGPAAKSLDVQLDAAGGHLFALFQTFVRLSLVLEAAPGE